MLFMVRCIFHGSIVLSACAIENNTVEVSFRSAFQCYLKYHHTSNRGKINRKHVLDKRKHTNGKKGVGEKFAFLLFLISGSHRTFFPRNFFYNIKIIAFSWLNSMECLFCFLLELNLFVYQLIPKPSTNNIQILNFLKDNFYSLNFPQRRINYEEKIQIILWDP